MANTRHPFLVGLRYSFQTPVRVFLFLFLFFFFSFFLFLSFLSFSPDSVVFFFDQQKLYFVLDYVSGGELFFHLQSVRRFPEPQVQFYAAEILLALEYLHQINIIYRDLKPENVLLDGEGHVALTDFGLSKFVEKTTNTFCGTPEYLGELFFSSFFLFSFSPLIDRFGFNSS